MLNAHWIITLFGHRLFRIVFTGADRDTGSFDRTEDFQSMTVCKKKTLVNPPLFFPSGTRCNERDLCERRQKFRTQKVPGLAARISRSRLFSVTVIVKFFSDLISRIFCHPRTSMSPRAHHCQVYLCPCRNCHFSGTTTSIPHKSRKQLLFIVSIILEIVRTKFEICS